MRPARAAVLASLIAGVALSATPGLARANGLNLCVNATGCSQQNTFTTLEAAEGVADGDAQKDTIHIGAGTFSPDPSNGSKRFIISSLVDIIGAGTSSTFLQAPDPNNVNYTIFLQKPGSSITGLTIRQNNAATYGLLLSGSTADGVVVTAADDRPANNGRGVYFFSGNSTLKNSTVTMPLGAPHNDWAVFAASGGSDVIDNVTLTGDNAVVQQAGTVAVTRSRLTGHRVYVVNGSGNATLATSVVRATAGSTADPIGLENSSTSGNVTSITATALTIVGPGAGDGLLALQDLNCGGGSSTITVNSTTVSGFPNATRQQACANADFETTCGAPAASSANIQGNYSHYDGSVPFPSGGCLGSNNMRSGSPGFVSSSDLRPRQPSPLIDNGDPAPDSGGEIDFAGAPRVVEGDSSGGARRDIGAYEYQRQAPVIHAKVTPGSGPPSTAFAFTVDATDPDGDALQFIWEFDDGAVVGGQSVSHAFAAFGTHTGKATVTDGGSRSATDVATVSVANPPVPTVVPTVVPPKDVTAPVITAKAGTIVVDSKGVATFTVTCPATETAPCKIGVDAQSAKKIAFKTKGKKKITLLGTGTGSVPAGRTATVKVKLSKAAFSYLKKKKKLKAKFVITASDVAGNSARSTASATLKAPLKKKRKKQ